MMDDGEEPEVQEKTPLVPLPHAHPEEDLPHMDYDAEVTASGDGFGDLKIEPTGFVPNTFSLPVHDVNVSSTVPSFAMMRGLREVAKNTQSDTWNPIAEGTPPPWMRDGWVPASTQWVSEKNAAYTASAAADPSTLANVIAGRNLAVTSDLEMKDEELGFPGARINKEVYRQSSAYEPFLFQQLLSQQVASSRFGPVRLVDSDYGSVRTLG